ncbi:MAG: YgiQ family radical SAM protein, partial [Planctomycetia bacterium]|nr:YgiQ family radical SAM protein [Planctomycetia bacterium]
TIIAGGVEASMRRLAHYDYWSDKVKRSILFDSKASLVSYGMGETSLVEIFRRLDAGEQVETIRDVRGTVYRLGKTEDLPEESETLMHLPSFEEVAEDKTFFATMTKIAYQNLNPYSAKTLVQEHGEEAIVVNPPSLPLSTEEMDRVYGLPYTRRPHPAYDGHSIPAFEVVRYSVPVVRGCFGGCAFCSLTAHQGKFVQCRSEQSVLNELKSYAADKDFHGTISDLGGPTANMYKLGCTNEEKMKVCRRVSCLHPEICPNLNTDHGPLIELMQKAREIDGIKNVLRN